MVACSGWLLSGGLHFRRLPDKRKDLAGRDHCQEWRLPLRPAHDGAGSRAVAPRSAGTVTVRRTLPSAAIDLEGDTGKHLRERLLQVRVVQLWQPLGAMSRHYQGLGI